MQRVGLQHSLEVQFRDAVFRGGALHVAERSHHLGETFGVGFCGVSVARSCLMGGG